MKESLLFSLFDPEEFRNILIVRAYLIILVWNYRWYKVLVKLVIFRFLSP